MAPEGVILSLGRRSGPICSVSAKGASSNQPGAKPQVRNRKTKMRAESPRQKHHIAAPHTYLSNAMKRAVGGPLALSSPPGHTISLSPTFNHTLPLGAHLESATVGPRTVPPAWPKPLPPSRRAKAPATARRRRRGEGPVRSGLSGVMTLEFSGPPRPSDVLRAGTARAPLVVSNCARSFAPEARRVAVLVFIFYSL